MTTLVTSALPGHLQAVGAVVVERLDVEQLVAEGDDLVAAARHGPTLRCPAMHDVSDSGGRGEFIDSLMDTELYSIGAFFCDEHPDLVDEVVARSVEIERRGLEAYAARGRGRARGDIRDAAHRARGPVLQGGRRLTRGACTAP